MPPFAFPTRPQSGFPLTRLPPDMTDAPDVAVIVVAAGSGSRLGRDMPKAFVDVGGRPMLERALESVFGMREAAQVIVVAPDAQLPVARQIAVKAAAGGEVPDVVAGGATRQDSVRLGLAALREDIGIVLVHDAARALTPSAQFDAVVDAVRAGAAGVVPGLDVVDTIKRIDSEGRIVGTVDRSDLSAVQTPQGFPRRILEEANADASATATDDAAIVAAAGYTVRVIAGDPLAFKITTAWDLRRAHLQLRDWSDATPKVGTGFDVHSFDDNAELWLAGLHWPGEQGLSGHSDGDAGSHAICDALLAAAGLGDVGSVFGTSDPRFSDAHGEVFLREVVRLVRLAGFRVGNVSLQLVGNRPKIDPRRTEAENLLSGILEAPVSVSATTTDGLGFAGRGEGVAAIATALLVPLTRGRPDLSWES